MVEMMTLEIKVNFRHFRAYVWLEVWPNEGDYDDNQKVT